MPLTYPGDCITSAQRIEFCFIAQEKLRKLHNAMSQWHDYGLTQVQYNQLPAKIKNRYPYAEFLEPEQRDDFHAVVFKKIERKITEKLLINRQALLDSVQWVPDLDGIYDD